MKNILKYTALFLLAILIYSCGYKNLKPVMAQSADGFNIVILSDDGIVKQGSGKLFLEFRNAADNQLVDVGKVEVSAKMIMPGMPMISGADVKVADKPGRYTVKYDFEMGGDWDLTISYDSDKSIVIPLSVI